MKKHFLFLFVCLLSFTSCNNDAQQSKSIKSQTPFSGSYLLQVNPEMIEKASEEADLAEKFILSILSPLKISATFKDNGYVSFEGEYGLLDFTEIDSKADSLKFLVKDDRLYIDEIEINEEDYLTFKLLEDNKILLIADSLELILSPLNNN